MINDQVRTLRTNARMAGEQFEFRVYTLLLGEFERVDKQVSDEQALNIIRKMVKDNNATMECSPSDALAMENNILQQFLPQEMSQDEITDIAVRFYESDFSIGQFMKELKTSDKEVDMKLARQIWLDVIG